MNDATDSRARDPKSQPDNVARYERWGKWAAAIAGVGYVLLWRFGGHERFGPIGDAMGPLTGVLTALALFAAIEGVRLQREELKLQREELAASREVMREQARAAERSAETQERLAKAQEALADAQTKANLIACAAHVGALDSTMAGLAAKLLAVRHDRNLQLDDRETVLNEYAELLTGLEAHRDHLNALHEAIVDEERAARANGGS